MMLFILCIGKAQRIRTCGRHLYCLVFSV